MNTMAYSLKVSTQTTKKKEKTQITKSGMKEENHYQS